MFKNLNGFQKGCLVVTVIEAIVMYGGMALMAKALEQEVRENDELQNKLAELALREVEKVKA